MCVCVCVCVCLSVSLFGSTTREKDSERDKTIYRENERERKRERERERERERTNENWRELPTSLVLQIIKAGVNSILINYSQLQRYFRNFKNKNRSLRSNKNVLLVTKKLS